MPHFPIDGFQSSLWFATAIDAPSTEPLSDVLRADAVVVGAGITGLNAAIELAENGLTVVVLEAGVIGAGASGRNGGQVNLGLNLSPDELCEHYGEARARPLINALCCTPQTVFKRIQRFKLKCDAEQNGWVQGAVTERRFADQRALAAEYARHGLELQVLDAMDIAEATGSTRYVGGLFIEQCGSIQPLSYTRELARVAMEQGVKVHTQSAVQSLRRSRTNTEWEVATATGRVNAEHVLVCTNGYTDKVVSGLAKKVIPARSIQVATEPLSANMRRKILPSRVTWVDKRRMILYGRYDRDGRLCVGDHGPMRDAFRLDDFDAVKKRAVDVFPDLAGVRWDYHWGGRLAITKDHLPFLYAPAAGLHIGMGYNGRGVGMGSMMGLALASRVLGKPAEQAFMPVTTPNEYVLHAFHQLGAKVVIQWQQLLDHLEISGADESAHG